MKLGLAAVAATLLGLVFPARGDVPVNWRNDGSGHFPTRTPPQRWSAATHLNVRWQTALPSWSNASPVIAGNRVIVCSEPDVILCFDRDDGHLLWQSSGNVVDALPKEQAAAAREELARGEAAAVRLEAIRAEHQQLKRSARKGGGGPEVDARITALSEERARLQAVYDQSSRYRAADPLPILGSSTSTPVSDGKRVFASFGNGVIAAWDLSGKKLWSKWFGIPTRNMRGYFNGHAASLLLAGGKVIVAFDHLMGLDPDDGRIAWTGPEYIDYGTPSQTVLDGADVLLTPAGEMVRGSDGKVLASGLGDIFYMGPLVEKGWAYFLGSRGDQEMVRIGHNNANAVRLLDPQSGKLSPSPQWHADLPTDRFYASPIAVDGILYAVNGKGILTSLDAATGQVVETLSLVKGQGETTFYPSLAVAGGLLYVTAENGVTLVFTPGRKLVQRAENQLEPMRATPVFQGNRMYARGMDHLYCVEEKSP